MEYSLDYLPMASMLTVALIFFLGQIIFIGLSIRVAMDGEYSKASYFLLLGMLFHYGSLHL